MDTADGGEAKATRGRTRLRAGRTGDAAGDECHGLRICVGAVAPHTVLFGSRRDDAKGSGPPSSSGPGPRPFTAVARVRIPLGVLTRASDYGSRRVWLRATRGLVAQLVSAPPCHGGGRGFKSRRGRGRSVRSSKAGPMPSRGSVAQLVERSTENRKVTGSTPVGATAKGPEPTRFRAFAHCRASLPGTRRARPLLRVACGSLRRIGRQVGLHDG